MSETDSFIDEVTEEVRRDQLFAFFRKYGWIGIVGVLLIVGGAAWSEWQKARAEAQAEAFGDAIISAIGNSDAKARADALRAIEPDGGAGHALILGFLSATEAEAAGDTDGALAALKAVADNPDVGDVYRQLAQLKTAMIGQGMLDPAARDAMLEALAQPGAPFRALAMEQQALALVDGGKPDEAAALLTQIIEDADSTAGLKGRATQLLTALGKAPAASE